MLVHTQGAKNKELLPATVNSVFCEKKSLTSLLYITALTSIRALLHQKKNDLCCLCDVHMLQVRKCATYFPYIKSIVNADRRIILECNLQSRRVIIEMMRATLKPIKHLGFLAPQDSVCGLKHTQEYTFAMHLVFDSLKDCSLSITL